MGRTPDEQHRAESFALDLARWLVGAPRESLAPLARVVTLVAKRELRDARRLCADHPLMAVEAAARATEALWPLLRGPLPPEEPEEEEPPPPPKKGESEASEAGSAGGAGGSGEGEASEESAEQAGDGDGAGEGDPTGSDDTDSNGDEPAKPEQPAAAKALAQLADLDGADEELQRLAEALKAALSDDASDDEIANAAGELLGRVGESATEGALETARVARHLEHFLPGVGWSSAPRELELSLLENLDTLARLLEQLDALADLAQQLGRVEEASSRRGERIGGSEEVVGVTLGGEVSLALPSELALLGDPETEDLFYSRLLEHRLVSLELTGAGLHGSASGDERGPVIACIDTSGSMEGPPELAAKALVLALCRRVLPRGRVVHLILFGGQGQKTELRLRRGRGGLEGLIDFLSTSFRAGTDFDVPLSRAVELLMERDLHSADVLVVTDGLCRASPSIIDDVNAMRRREGVRVWTVLLGLHDVGGVRPFSDEVIQVDPTDAAKAAGWMRKMDVPVRW